jgi:hypothetical protein
MPPSLLYIAPNEVKFEPIVPAEYAAVVAALQANKQASHLTVTENSGCVTFQGKVDFTWEYDGAQSMKVAIVKKHGMAGLVPNATIFDELAAQLTDLQT